MRRDEEYLEGQDVIDGPLVYKFFRSVDENPDLSWLGEYTDKPKYPFYDCSAHVLVICEYEEETSPDDDDPYYDTITKFKAFESGTIDGRKDAIRLIGYDSADHRSNRHEFRYIDRFQNPPKDDTDLDGIRACLWDAERLASYNNQSWNMTIITCRVFVMVDEDDEDPEELNDCHSSLCGVESDASDAYIKEVCHELMGETAHDVAKMARLRIYSAGVSIERAKLALAHLLKDEDEV